MTGLALAVLAGAASDATAQSLGLGARMVSISGPESPALEDGDPSNTRFAGGFLRLNATESLASKRQWTSRRRRTPPKRPASATCPSRSRPSSSPSETFAPYPLAGVGWYRHRVEALNDGKAVVSAYTTEFGYHTGLGGS